MREKCQDITSIANVTPASLHAPIPVLVFRGENESTLIKMPWLNQCLLVPHNLVLKNDCQTMKPHSFAITGHLPTLCDKHKASRNPNYPINTKKGDLVVFWNTLVGLAKPTNIMGYQFFRLGGSNIPSRWVLLSQSPGPRNLFPQALLAYQD